MGASPHKIGRRAFLGALQASLGGLVVALEDDDAWAAPPQAAAPQGGAGLAPNAFVHVATSGLVTIVCHRSEMGQGVRSSIPPLIADELGASLTKIAVEQAVGDRKYGDQNTDGSSSIRKFYDDLRMLGATARTMLVAAAAKRWRVKPETCTTRDHAVVHEGSKRSLAFAELVEEAAKLPVPKPAEVRLRPEAELKHLTEGRPALLDGPAIVQGMAKFGADVRLPNMLIAVIARPPVVGGKPTRFDTKAALAVPGVKHVFELPAPKAPYGFQPLGGVAVLATDTWSAMRGRRALAVEWNDGDNAVYDSTTYREKLLASVRAEGTTARQVGDALGVLAKAKRVVEAEYVVPHLAHLTMEPPAAIARIENGACEIWAPTQHPQAARTEAARILGIGEDKVTVNVTLLGGGFGRKSKADFVGEAAYLAAQAKVPVRVQWTREDDVRHCYYNAVNAQRLRAALDDGGKVQAWHHRTAFTPIASTFKAGVDRPGLDDLQQGVLDLALDVPNVRAETCTAPVHARIGWFRSVYNIFHAFAIGSFIDEIAHARGEDPRKVLLEVIGPARKLGLADLGIGQLRNYGEKLEKHPVDAGRLRNVVERVTAAAKWSGRKQGNRGFGLAAHRSFVSYTAVVVAVVEDPRAGVRVDEAWISMDPGLVVNKERVHAQMQGSVIMGISNAMYGGITMKKGAVEQSNFNDARIVRLNEAPRRIHVDLVASTAPPGGVGEPGVPPVGAALANAVFALTGKRVREMPIAAALRK